ncbi:MAG: hypothetical protein WA880_16795 [Ornithinimicrobium sp.]
MKIPCTRLARAAVVALASVTLIAAPSATSSASVATPASASPYCGITWGSTPEAAGDMEAGLVQGVRAGRHTCYDRMVIDMSGDAPGYDVRYVKTVRADGSGAAVPVAGGARLAIVAKKGATFAPTMPSVSGYDTFRQIRWAGSFEGQTTFALGVRARLPFRAFTLYDASTDTSRLVVDVAPRW